METTKEQITKGGTFLIQETEAGAVFIPEEWSEEQKMIVQTCRDFIEQEVYPKLDELDSQKNPELMPQLLDKAAELGLLGVSIPEKYGGIGMDLNTSMLIVDALGSGHCFVVAFSAHTGIGTLPILYYGNDEQKEKYLPKLVSGEIKAAYCLTEPDSGSDANAAKSKAILSKDGKHYVLNGQKMWITNGGFADLFIVFAKIEDDKDMSAFIVEKAFGGITMNEEERKMGIKGSSTRQMFFNDCKIPVENLLHERGNGFKIALNILNIGRIKLASSCIGGSKDIISASVKYANERKQFGKAIGEFGAIKYKLAEMAARAFASESAVYRAGNDIDTAYRAFVEEGMNPAQARLKSLEEFAIECAIMKVHGSEVLDYCADEGVQIYGGMGYSAEAPMDRAYRDARINRIFEGTNEINRLLTIDMLLKRAMKGRLDLMGPAMEVAKELTSIPDLTTDENDTLLGWEKIVLKNLKKAGLMIAGASVQKYMQKIEEEQEILMNLADMLIEGYVAESTVLRVEKLIGLRGEENCLIQSDLMHIYLYNAVENASRAGREAIYAFTEGDEQRMMLMGLKRFTKVEPFNLKEARRRVANHMLEKNAYKF